MRLRMYHLANGDLLVGETAEDAGTRLSNPVLFKAIAAYVPTTGMAGPGVVEFRATFNYSMMDIGVEEADVFLSATVSTGEVRPGSWVETDYKRKTEVLNA